MNTTSHLDEAQIVEAADGQGDHDAITHLAGCRTCGDRVSELRSILQSVASVDVPEPSPLFWDHFPARVGRAIEAAPERGRGGGWLSASRWIWGSAATAAVVMVLLLLPLRRDTVVPAGKIEPPNVIVSSDSDAGVVESLEGDEAWDMVRSVAEETDYDDVQDGGLSPRPGSLERAAMELNNDERAELARLIEQEMKRAGASTP